MRYEAGIVMRINKNKAILMTKQGEFIEVKVTKQEVKIGQEFSGQIIESIPFYKYSFIAASILLMLFIGGGAYAYYTPVSDITVSINPKIKLQGNRWNKIIKTIPLNEDGEKVLKNISIKNKTLEQGLNLIVDEAKNENFINNDYITSGKVIEVIVESKGDLKVDLSKFKSNIESSNLKIKIEKNEEKIKGEENINKENIDRNSIKEDKDKEEYDSSKSNKIDDNGNVSDSNNKKDKNDIKKDNVNPNNTNSNKNDVLKVNSQEKDKTDKKNNEKVNQNENNVEKNQKNNENKLKNESDIKREDKNSDSKEKIIKGKK